MKKQTLSILLSLVALTVSGCTRSNTHKPKRRSSESLTSTVSGTSNVVTSDSSENISSQTKPTSESAPTTVVPSVTSANPTTSSNTQQTSSNPQPSSNVVPASSTVAPASSTVAPASSSVTPVSSTVTPASSSVIPASSSVTPSTSSTPSPTDDYYKSISDSLTGTELKNALHKLNDQMKVRDFVYNDHKTYQKLTEIDPKGTIPNGKMLGFYDNTFVNASWDNQATWNREHVWPNSRGGNKVEGDLHMVRPTSVKINSERGNNVYGTGSGTYDPGQYIAEYRGIAARIIFYCAIADTSLTLNEDTDNEGNNMGVLSTLLRWNLQYRPEGENSTSLAYRVEWNRNEVIQKNSQLQGNRNPFIDHPEYACRIWGSQNSATRAACGM